MLPLRYCTRVPGGKWPPRRSSEARRRASVSLRFSSSSSRTRSPRPCSSAFRRRTSLSSSRMPRSSMAEVASSLVAAASAAGSFSVVSMTSCSLPCAASRCSCAFSCCSRSSSACSWPMCSRISRSSAALLPCDASRPVLPPGSGGGGIFWQAATMSWSVRMTDGCSGSSRASKACFANAKMRSQRPPFIRARVCGNVLVSMILASRWRPFARSRASTAKPCCATMSSRISASSAQE
mmetsp:Transcript_114447/g.369826  ORF Transcript_114447/g.369826 Transcript_114447/m.369826 type:complete len:237 (+) Transcript_114447:536-1246(+)